MRFVDKNLVQKDCWLQLVGDSSGLGSKAFLALLGKNPTEYQQLHLLALLVIDSKMVS